LYVSNKSSLGIFLRELFAQSLRLFTGHEGILKDGFPRKGILRSTRKTILKLIPAK
jgi:hypothetical protein